VSAAPVRGAAGGLRRWTSRARVDPRLADLRWWAAAVAAGLLAFSAGVPVPDALVIVAAVVLLGVVVPLLDAGRDAEWPAAPVRPRDGRRLDVAVLTWSLAGRDGRVSEAALRRVREIAVRRLARVGLPLSAGLTGPADQRGEAERAAAAEALGPRAWAALTAPSGSLPSIADIAACVRALENVVDRQPETREHSDDRR
jgi:hypothetical protein